MSDDPVTGINLTRDFETAKARMSDLADRIRECIEIAKERGIDAAGIETALVTPAAFLIAQVDDDEAREFRIVNFCTDLCEQIEFYRTGTYPMGATYLSPHLLNLMKKANKKP